jgi:hypothetical protein
VKVKKMLLMIRTLFVVVLVATFTLAQNSTPQLATATSVRVEKPEIYGPLFVTIAGKEKQLTGQAQQAWIINGGRHVVYSSSEGSGGYENEGQSLHVYDIAADKHSRIMSEYFMVDDVKEVVTSNKKRALLVTMSDGGLGASYIAVVDPSRGEVFFRRWARILSQKGDTIVLGLYKEDDWEKLDSAQGKVRAYKREIYDLKSLLKRRVIVNKRDDPT